MSVPLRRSSATATATDTQRTLHNNCDTIKRVTPAGESHALIELLSRFALAIDTRDWPAYRAVFTDEFELDYSSWNPRSIGRWRADDWVERATKLFPGLTHSRHTVTNHLAKIEGDHGSIRAHVTAEHVIVEHGRTDVFTLNGFYDDRCTRTPDGWRISGKKLVAQWSTGDPDVMSRARARAAAILGHPGDR
jgi:3-phenylpropionate/cinnamic acid dioxygenase small subunit